MLALDRKVLHRYTVAGWSILKQISQSYCKLVLTDCCYCIYRCRFRYPFQETVVKKNRKKKPTFIYKVNIHILLYDAILVLKKTKTKIHLIFRKVSGIFWKNGWHKTNCSYVHERYKKYVEFISNKNDEKKQTNRAQNLKIYFMYNHVKSIPEWRDESGRLKLPTK